MRFDYYALGDAAVSLGIPKSTLRYYCELGKIRHKRASDGSRLIAPAAVERARAWLKEHTKQAAADKQEAERRRVAKAEFNDKRRRERLAKSA